MAYREIKAVWNGQYPKGTSERFKDLDALDKMLAQQFYDILPHPFDKEEEGGKHIPISNRRPSVQVSLPKVIVNQTSALLFGEAHAPHIRYWIDAQTGSETPEQLATQDAIEKLVYASEAISIMMEAVKKGSTGSCAIVMYALPDGSPYLDVVEGKTCQPVFNPRDPRELLALHRVYPVHGRDLYDLGYSEEDYKAGDVYWMRIELTKTEEVWMYPLPNDKYQSLGADDPALPGQKIHWSRDEERSSRHGFGFTPAVWIRNMGERRQIDGPCTFEAIVDIQVELDYTISMAGRGYHYTADPMLALIDGDMADLLPAGGDSELDGGGEGDGGSVAITKSPARALSIAHGGDAKMLEITGKGLEGSLNYARLLREYAFEVLSGNKADQDHTKGGNAQSGRALEVLTQALVWLVEELRTPYGLRGYLPLVKMMLVALKNGDLELPDVKVEAINPALPLRLFWPEWYRPIGQELMNHIEALVTAAGGTSKVGVQIIPIEVAAREAAMILNEPDPNETVRQLLKENPVETQQKLRENTLVPPPPPTPAAAPSGQK